MRKSPVTASTLTLAERNSTSCLLYCSILFAAWGWVMLFGALVASRLSVSCLASHRTYSLRLSYHDEAYLYGACTYPALFFQCQDLRLNTLVHEV